MTLVLVTTPGSASANAYLTVAQVTAVADALFPPTSWGTTHDAEDLARAVVTATKQMDRLAWMGEPATTTQALAWPRLGVRDPHTGLDIDTAVIPSPVLEATARLAIWLIDQPDDPFAGDADGGLEEFSLGVEFRARVGQAGRRETPGAAFVTSVLRPILRGLLRSAQPRLVRG